MRGEAGQGWGGAKQVRSKKFKLIPAISCGVGLKSRSIPAPPPLRDEENLPGTKWGRTGQAEWGKFVIPSYYHLFIT